MIKIVAKIIYKLVLCTCVLLCSINASAGYRADYKFKQLTDIHGLSDNSISCFYQDKDGFLWIGTHHGLNRYDGVTVLNFNDVLNDEQQLSNSYINDITQDKQGRLWVATNYGINIIDVEKRRVIARYSVDNMSEYASSNVVLNVHCDKNNNIWVATRNEILVWDATLNTVTNLFVKEQVQHKIVIDNRVDIEEDHLGNVFIGSSDFVLKFNIDTEESALWRFPVRQVDGANELRVNDLYVHEGDLWVATNSAGVYKINTANNDALEILETVSLQAKNGFPIRSICIHDNVLWMGSQGHGLYLYDFNDKTVHRQKHCKTDESSISWDVILSVYKTDCGTMWIGTYGKGCDYWHSSTQKFVHFRSHNNNALGIDMESVSSVITDCYNRIWIGGYGVESSINIIDREKNELTLIPTDKLEYISELHADKEDTGIVWATKSGKGEQLFKIDVETQEIIESINLIENHTLIFDVNEQDNKLWIASDKGLFSFDKQTKQVDHHILSISKNKPLSVPVYKTLLEKDGEIWLATSKGLLHYNTDNKVKNFYNPHGENGLTINELVRDFVMDEKGLIWMATNKGLMCFNTNDNKFVAMPKLSSGSLNELIICIEQDNDGKLWLGTNKGLTCYNPIDRSIISYTTDDGLQGNIFSQNASHKSADGELFFGGANGLNAFRPEDITSNNYSPTLKITDLFIYNKVVEYNPNSEVTQILTKSIEYTDTLHLAYAKKIISFAFASLNFVSSAKSQYSYKLEGFDNEWSVAANRHYITYTNLAPGTYTLKAKASNNDGVWNDESTSLTIIIDPPFYLTWWFKTLFTLFIISLLWGFYFIRIRILRNNEKHLKALVEERTISLSETNVLLEEKSEEITLQKELLEQKNEEILTQNEVLEEHRNNLEKLVVDRTQKLEKAMKRAEASDKLKSAFLANMSHEIRTPMNSIIGFSTLLKIGQLSDEERNKYIDQIQTNGDSLLHLIDDIIDLSKIEAGELNLIPKSFDMNELMHELLTTFKHEASRLEKEHINLSLEIEAQIPEGFITDPYRLKQVMSNLLSNAVKYTSEGMIEFGVKNGINNSLLFYVKDTGIGIAKEHHQLIFDRFNKALGSDEFLYGGTGLGLSISTHIVNSLGGQINVESTQGKGSYFYFNLPLLYKTL